MQIEIVKQEKDSIEVNIDNVTVAEVLRVYLAEQGVDFVAWRREHPSKPALFKLVSGKGIKKEVHAAVSAITKECGQLRALVKK